jgi:predicted MFS family arabinose efflux permease
VVLLPVSLWGLIVGVITMDFGLQAAHVANQSLIYRLRPEARSRLAAAYMIFYSIGSAMGSMLSTILYAGFGWSGVCAAGALVSTLALAFWWTTRHDG